MAAVRAKSHTGFPSVAQDYFSSDFSFDANIITHPDTTLIMRINGSSMEGAGIFHDDIVVITYEEELLLRRLTTNNQGNPVLSTYAMHDKDIHLYFDESITLWGVIIGSYHPQHSSVRNIRG